MKIKGLTSFYLSALSDDLHPLHDLVKMMSTLDPTFCGKCFEYMPQDKEMFLDLVDIDKALDIYETPGIEEFTGYPFFISTTSSDFEVPSFFPGSAVFDDDGNPTRQLSFSEWVESRNHTLYHSESLGVFFAGSFGKFGLDFALNIDNDNGNFDLMDWADAKAEIEALSDVQA